MKLEVGKIYLDICGDAWEVLHFRAGADFPFTARTIIGSLATTFSENGRAAILESHEYDLIKEAPEVVTIQLYRHRETGQVIPTACKEQMNAESFEHIKTIEVEL